MSVLACSRKRCDKIMCDTYVPGIGYICGECQEEFKNYLTQEGVWPMGDIAMTDNLERFVNTDKYSYHSVADEVNTFFKQFKD